MLIFGKWRKVDGYYELEVMLNTRVGPERFLLLRAVKQGDGSYNSVIRSAVSGRGWLLSVLLCSKILFRRPRKPVLNFWSFISDIFAGKPPSISRLL